MGSRCCRLRVSLLHHNAGLQLHFETQGRSFLVCPITWVTLLYIPSASFSSNPHLSQPSPTEHYFYLSFLLGCKHQRRADSKSVLLIFVFPSFKMVPGLHYVPNKYLIILFISRKTDMSTVSVSSHPLEREREGEGGREAERGETDMAQCVLPFTAFTPQMLATFGSWEFQVSHMGWQGPNYLSHHLSVSRKLESELGLNPDTPVWDASVLATWLKVCP